MSKHCALLSISPRSSQQTSSEEWISPRRVGNWNLIIELNCKPHHRLQRWIKHRKFDSTLQRNVVQFLITALWGLSRLIVGPLLLTFAQLTSSANAQQSTEAVNKHSKMRRFQRKKTRNCFIFFRYRDLFCKKVRKQELTTTSTPTPNRW